MLLAIELDPLEPEYSYNGGRFLYSMGRYEEAVQHFETTLELAPDHVSARWLLAWGHAQMGRNAEAAASLEGFPESAGLDEEIVAANKQVLVTSGYEGLREWRLEDPELWTVTRAEFLAELNRDEEALAALEQAFQERDPSLPYYLLGLPAFDPLHDEPRFQDLARQMNLPIPEDSAR